MIKHPCLRTLAGCFFLGGNLVGCQTPPATDCSPYLQRDLTITWATRSYWPTSCRSESRRDAMEPVESPTDSGSITVSAAAEPILTNPDTGVTSGALICVDGGC